MPDDFSADIGYVPAAPHPAEVSRYSVRYCPRPARLAALAAATVAVVAIAVPARAEEARITVQAKPGASCTKGSRTELSKVWKALGAKVTLCWFAGGDPAMNGAVLLLDVSRAGQKPLTWDTEANVYHVKKVQLAGRGRIVISAIEHWMDANGEVRERKATWTLTLAGGGKKPIGPALEVLHSF